MNTINIELGKTYSDSASGFTGVATARVEYLSATPRIQLTGKVNADGEVNDEWFDAPRLRYANAGAEGASE